jgi:hypothetical protein
MAPLLLALIPCFSKVLHTIFSDSPILSHTNNNMSPSGGKSFFQNPKMVALYNKKECLAPQYKSNTCKCKPISTNLTFRWDNIINVNKSIILHRQIDPAKSSRE